MTTTEQAIKAWDDRVMDDHDNLIPTNGVIQKHMQAEIDELRDALQERDAEIERLRVQLAGCGVAAMQNTEASKANRVKRGSYGWSESYGDVCRAVDREIEQRRVLEQAKTAAIDAYCHADDSGLKAAVNAIQELK